MGLIGLQPVAGGGGGGDVTTQDLADAIDAHTSDAADAHDASAISILDSANDFTATDVEGALAELQAADEADETALANHLSDAADAHDASAISILDTANDFTATDVEGALAELQSDNEAHLADSTAVHGITDTAALALLTSAASGVLTGSLGGGFGFASDIATQAELDAAVATLLTSALAASTYLTRVAGGGAEKALHGSAAVGATETISPADGNYHNLILDVDCTLTLTNPTHSNECELYVTFKQDANGGNSLIWPGTVTGKAGFLPTIAQAANAETDLILRTVDGGSSWSVAGGVTTFWDRKTGDFASTSDTALNDVPDMIVPILANEIWEVEWHCRVDNGDEAADLALTVTAPSGAAGWWAAHGISTSATTQAHTIDTFVKSFGSSNNYGIDGTNDTYLFVRAICVNGATPGNVTLQACQAVTSVTPTTINTNSFVKATRVG